MILEPRSKTRVTKAGSLDNLYFTRVLVILIVRRSCIWNMYSFSCHVGTRSMTKASQERGRCGRCNEAQADGYDTIKLYDHTEQTGSINCSLHLFM
jgi:hypothetical protein